MVSGFHRAQHHSASLLLYPSFIHSLPLLAFVSLFLVASHTQLSVYVHTPFVPLFFLPRRLLHCPLFFLFIPSIAFLFERSPSRFISRSLCPCLAQSIYPVPSRCRTTSVGLITYSRHTWTALTGINHEQFQVPIQGSSDCLC